MEGALQYLIYAFIGIVVFALATIFVAERKRKRAALAADASLMGDLTDLSEGLKSSEPPLRISYGELLDRVVDRLSSSPFPVDLYTKDAKRRAVMENKLIGILRTPTRERGPDPTKRGGPTPPVVGQPPGGSRRRGGPSAVSGPEMQAPVVWIWHYDPSTGKPGWHSYGPRFGFDFRTQPQKEEEKG
jgi:hypothetical protein